MNWKDVLKIFLGALLPLLYTEIYSHYPDFPLFVEDFVSIILWVVGLIVGGWGVGAIYMKRKLKKAGHNYEKLVSE